MNKVEKHGQICKSLNELYARKNADYGDSFGKSFKEYGLTMVCIRLEDKLNRIKSLRNKDAQVSDESITDTLMDLANYSIMTLVEMGQSEPSEAPLRGDHDSGCCRSKPECLCNKCVNDYNSFDCDACCVKHDFHGCPMTECPDYVKEDEQS